MAKKTEKIVLGDDTYEITQLGAVIGSELYDELVRVMGPKIKAQLGDIRALAAKSEGEVEATLGVSILSLVAEIPRELKKELRKEFISTTVVIKGDTPLPLGVGDLFDQHFAGRYAEMLAWELACIKHNFLNFLSSKPKPQS